MTNILSPIRIGPYDLPSRVVMAPLTRCRAPGNTPTALMAEYYAQRADPEKGAALIISEATAIGPRGYGYPNTPGIYTDAQIAAWKLTTEAVHRAGGRIFAQLWHVGRISHREYQPGGDLPVSASEVAPRGVGRLPDGVTTAPRPTPRALTIDEIRGVMEEYRHAAECALKAGFDGVEMHGANGYLPDQFLRDGTNRRTDAYGGSIENRARFHVEATHALCEVFGASRVGVRMSPSGTSAGIYDTTPRETFGHLVKVLGRMGLAYLHIMEAMDGDLTQGPKDFAGYEAIPVSFFRPLFRGTLITNAGFTLDKANRYLKEGWADAVAFGVPFIANPDLTRRFREGIALTEPDTSTFYTHGPRGYTDYPFAT